MKEVPHSGLQPGIMEGRGGDEDLVAVAFDFSVVPDLTGHAFHVRLVCLAHGVPGEHRCVGAMPYLSFSLKTDLAVDPIVPRSVDWDGSGWEWIR